MWEIEVFSPNFEPGMTTWRSCSNVFKPNRSRVKERGRRKVEQEGSISVVSVARTQKQELKDCQNTRQTYAQFYYLILF